MGSHPSTLSVSHKIEQINHLNSNQNNQRVNNSTLTTSTRTYDATAVSTASTRPPYFITSSIKTGDTVLLETEQRLTTPKVCQTEINALTVIA